jgi:hypothetical protein
MLRQAIRSEAVRSELVEILPARRVETDFLGKSRDGVGKKTPARLLCGKRGGRVSAGSVTCPEQALTPSFHRGGLGDIACGTLRVRAIAVEGTVDPLERLRVVPTRLRLPEQFDHGADRYSLCANFSVNILRYSLVPEVVFADAQMRLIGMPLSFTALGVRRTEHANICQAMSLAQFTQRLNAREELRSQFDLRPTNSQILVGSEGLDGAVTLVGCSRNMLR